MTMTRSHSAYEQANEKVALLGAKLLPSRKCVKPSDVPQTHMAPWREELPSQTSPSLGKIAQPVQPWLPFDKGLLLFVCKIAHESVFFCMQALFRPDTGILALSEVYVVVCEETTWSAFPILKAPVYVHAKKMMPVGEDMLWDCKIRSLKRRLDIYTAQWQFSTQSGLRTGYLKVFPPQTSLPSVQWSWLTIFKHSEKSNFMCRIDNAGMETHLMFEVISLLIIFALQVSCLNAEQIMGHSTTISHNTRSSLNASLPMVRIQNSDKSNTTYRCVKPNILPGLSVSMPESSLLSLFSFKMQAILVGWLQSKLLLGRCRGVSDTRSRLRLRYIWRPG